MSSHPNQLDRLAQKFYPGYLYPGQICHTVAPVNIGLLHKLPDTSAVWKIMDYLYLDQGSSLKYLGLSGKLKIIGDFNPRTNVMAVVHPVISESKSPGKHISPGDIVCITPADRKYLSAGNEPAGIFEKLAGTISPFPDQTR